MWITDGEVDHYEAKHMVQGFIVVTGGLIVGVILSIMGCTVFRILEWTLIHMP